ncbi:hypothetical protein [Longimicrobium sp.]|uniref:hypothetical protein n=1 Tax=Longimicrobium sp. TaxID=2029185 RepID=UPI002CB47CFA|nr:hypothetical protein [Longimicrobium sp.]HSU15990.1 hypothetical protein [Longimicrobium sp.]
MNRKLKLNAEDLTIESFVAAEPAEVLGTVKAQDMYASSLLTCIDTNCGKTYCTTKSPCAC